MNNDAKLLVATDVAADADLILKQIGIEYANVNVAGKAEDLARHFDSQPPDILILAFESLETTKQCYRELYSVSQLAHSRPHRTIVLCSKDDLPETFVLCKEEVFDDYVLFWPMVHDVPRLLIAIDQSLRHLASDAALPSASEFASRARRLGELEGALDDKLVQYGEQLEKMEQELVLAEKGVVQALDTFCRNLGASGMVEVKDPNALQQEINRLKTEEVSRLFGKVGSTIKPLRQLGEDLKSRLAPQIDSARALKLMADRVRPLILVVDDDDFHLKLIGQLLATAQCDAITATTGAEALAVLRKSRPDLVLMDVNLPDVDGVEATRRMKSDERFGTVPIIMITGRSEKDIVIGSLQAGAADFIVKPVNKDVLLQKIKRLLSV